MTFSPLLMKEILTDGSNTNPHNYTTAQPKFNARNLTLMTPAQLTSSTSYPSMTPEQSVCSILRSSPTSTTNLLEMSNHCPERTACHQFVQNHIQLSKQKHISVVENKYTKECVQDADNCHAVSTETQVLSKYVQLFCPLQRELKLSPSLYTHENNISHNVMASTSLESESLPLKFDNMRLMKPDEFHTSEVDQNWCLQPKEKKSDNSITRSFVPRTFSLSNVESEVSYENEACCNLEICEPESPIYSKTCDSCNFYTSIFEDTENNSHNLLNELYTMLSDPSNPNLTRENGATTNAKIIEKLRKLFSLNGSANSEIVTTKEAATQANIPRTWGSLVSSTKAFSNDYGRVAAVMSGREGYNYFSDEINPIGVFWDIENMMIPKTIKPAHLVENIRRIFMNSHWEGDFICACNIWTVTNSMALVNEILAEEVYVHYVCCDKNAADITLVRKIEHFSKLHGPAGTIVIITSDADFGDVIYRMRYEFKHYVILVHSPNCPESLKALANETIKFKELTESWFGPLQHDWVPYTIDASCKTDSGPKYPRFQYKKVPRL